MKIFVTGASGFVGGHLYDALKRRFPDASIVGAARSAGESGRYGALEALDVVNAAAVEEAIARMAPDAVVHLAGIAAPQAANNNPNTAWETHLFGALNIARAVMKSAPDAFLVYAGSGLVYGATAKSGKPLSETDVVAPTDEYSSTKAAADLALGALAGRGLKCARMRPFNHTGPGQSADFVIPAFASQIAEIEAGLRPPVISVGNLDAARDFLDVRDVADAYALALQHRERLAPGEILNIASGAPRKISDILQMLLAASAVEIKIEQDPARMRPSDVSTIAGDASRARDLLGWSPTYALETTMNDVMEYWRSKVRASA